MKNKGNKRQGKQPCHGRRAGTLLASNMNILSFAPLDFHHVLSSGNTATCLTWLLHGWDVPKRTSYLWYDSYGQRAWKLLKFMEERQLRVAISAREKFTSWRKRSKDAQGCCCSCELCAAITRVEVKKGANPLLLMKLVHRCKLRFPQVWANSRQKINY
jgi:hypothetical protein